MSANKHTPGPWFVHKGSRWSHVKAENGDYIMEASRRSVARHHADARLIAAAPELLEALQTLVNSVDPESTGWSEAVVAIDKATGGAQ